MRRWMTLLSCLLLTVGAAPPTAEIREWPVPWKDTRPRDPAVDRQGRIWFAGQTGDYIGRFEPATEKFVRFELEPGTGPHNVIVANGEVWFTGNRKGYIGRLDPRSGKIVKYPMPEAAAGDPHTLVLAANGDLWFTVQNGGYVGRLEPKSGAIRLVKVPTRGARPYGIVVDASGKPWFNEFGTNAVGSIDPKTMELEEHRLPEPTARGRRIALAGDAGIWYVDYARGFLARLDSKSGKVEEWQTPAGASSLPYALASDDRGRLWLVETGPQPNRLVGFDPKSRRFFSVTEIASGGSTVRHMIFDPRERTLWFGTDKNTLARARVP
ncbi:MAG TPA: lyase [Thermoanaerobaculia bacterium]|nr:lyase [Thermoanaerobaculia bacterium]